MVPGLSITDGHKAPALLTSITVARMKHDVGIVRNTLNVSVQWCVRRAVLWVVVAGLCIAP